MPDIVAVAAGRTDKKLALMQLEQFAEEVVGVANVTRVVNQRGKLCAALVRNGVKSLRLAAAVRLAAVPSVIAEEQPVPRPSGD